MRHYSKLHRGDRLATPLDWLGLSVRATNALRKAEVKTLGGLGAMRSEELLDLRCFGRTCLAEVEELLEFHGLKLARRLQPDLQLDGSTEPHVFELTSAQRGWLAQPLGALTLSKRALSVLDELGLQWIGDLVLLDPSDLVTLKSVGRRSIQGIQAELQKRGLSLGLEIPEWSAATREDWHRQFGRIVEREVQRETGAALRKHGARAGELGSELRALAQWIMGDRNGAMMIRLLGWDGEAPKTLEEVGAEFGLTRERIRQLGVRFQRIARLRSVAPASLVNAYKSLTGVLPCRVEATPALLDRVGTGIDDLHVGGVLRAADLYGFENPYRIHNTGDMAGFLCDELSEELGRRTVQEARRSTSRRGCFRLEALSQAISERLGRSVSVEAVRRVIDAHPVVDWLDADREWGWAPDVGRSRLFRVIRQVLQVAPRVSLADLRSAIRRDLRMDGFTPPLRVLEAIADGLEWAECDGLYVCARGEITGLLPNSNFDIIRDALEEAGGVLDRYSLVDACCERGMNINSCQLLLIHTPVVVPLGSQVFSLIGVDVPPGTVERLRPKESVVRVAKDHGWTSDGRPWFAVNASRSVIVNGLMNVPVGLQRYVKGTFTVVDAANGLAESAELEDELETAAVNAADDEGTAPQDVAGYEIRVNGPMLTGLRALLADRAAEVGDTVVVIFDLQCGTVRLEIGDEILRAEFE